MHRTIKRHKRLAFLPADSHASSTLTSIVFLLFFTLDFCILWMAFVASISSLEVYPFSCLSLQNLALGGSCICSFLRRGGRLDSYVSKQSDTDEVGSPVRQIGGPDEQDGLSPSSVVYSLISKLENDTILFMLHVASVLIEE